MDIDHVVVAPAGVFAIETKWHFSESTPRLLRSFAAQAAENARKTASVLRSVDIKQPYAVVPIVVVWSRGQRGMPHEGQLVDGVLVLAGADLATWLKLQSSGPVAAGDAARLLKNLERFAASRSVPT